MQVTYDDLSAFILCCIGRANDYALQLSDGKYARQGQPIDFDLVYQHLTGRLTLGTYVISELNTCNFAVFDHDSPEPSVGLVVLLNIQSRLAEVGVTAYLERSRRGGHLWVFCLPTHPALLRAWLLPFCPADPQLEFYPKQDRLSDGSPYGACIRVPLGLHRLTGERYRFVFPVGGQLMDLFSSWSDAFAFFARVSEHRNVPPPNLVLSESEPSPIRTSYPSKTVSSSSLSPDCLDSQARVNIRQWCLSQDPQAVIGRYVELDQQGHGHCPFGSHHSDGVDRHPSFYVYYPTAPHIMCWYCHAWKQGGSLFDFLKLYYSMTARDLWVVLQQGAQV